MSSDAATVDGDSIDPAEVVRRFYRAYDTGDVDAALAHCTDDYRWHGFDDSGRAIDLDRAGFREAIESFRASFPDSTVEIIETIAMGDRIAVRLRETAHHDGLPWRGREADGIAAAWYPFIVYRVAGDRLAEEWTAPIRLDVLAEEPIDGVTRESRSNTELAPPARVETRRRPGRDEGRFEGRHAVVTGGASGIGLAISRALVAEGARVTIAARTRSRGRAVVKALGSAARWQDLDISDATGWQRLVAAAALDPIDILVNNAGGLLYAKQLHELEPDEWDREIAANLTGHFLGMHAVIPHMVAHGGGVIVNMSSISGVRGQIDAPGYQAAKGGLRMLTMNAALTYAAAGIRVNSIVPGAILTDAVLAEPQERVAPFIARTPLGRQGSPEEVAAVALFLASDDASFVTGAEYTVDGGYLT